MPNPTPSRTYFENSQPILRVEDMKAALSFYVDKLGFQNASWGTEDFTSVNRDRSGIYLCRGGQGRGGAIRMPLANFSRARASSERSGRECAAVWLGPVCGTRGLKPLFLGAP